jgi:transketolase
MFSEYARNALRMAALMKVPSIFVYSHDSIGLGEDGPTHQAVEQIPTLRMIPNMAVWRPCDAVESAVCWKLAIERKDGPSCLIFSRQNLDHQMRTPEQIANIARGGYVLRDCEGTPEVIIIATGSEVSLATGAAEQLADRKVRVVSMPSTTTFDKQDEAYRESVLPAAVTARVAVEAAVTEGWYKYVGLGGKVVGIDRFGESAPAGQLFKEFGFTVDNVVKAVNSII